MLREIDKKSGDSEALIVAHGGIVRLMYLIQNGKAIDEIENASLHSFDLDTILAKK